MAAPAAAAGAAGAAAPAPAAPRRRARPLHPASTDDALFVGDRLTEAKRCAICFDAFKEARAAWLGKRPR
jgi:hypothetical protein